MTVDYALLLSSDPPVQLLFSPSSLSVGVHCMNCDKLIDKDRGRSDSNSSSIATLDNKQKLLPTFCQDCNNWAQYCAICQSSIRGYFAVCSLCGHGGHTAHMRLWFETCGECATGCGCKCSLIFQKRVSNSNNNLLDDLDGEEGSDINEYNEDEDEDGDIHYDRAGVITVYGGGAGEVLGSDSKPGYDTYDFNRPYDSSYDSSNYSRYNYNNFFEQMKDYPGSIMEEGSGSEEDS